MLKLGETMKKFILIIAVTLVGILKVEASVSSAYEYVLMDMTTGRVLAGKNYNTPKLIASITKIMTSTIAIESGKLQMISLYEKIPEREICLVENMNFPPGIAEEAFKHLLL